MRIDACRFRHLGTTVLLCVVLGAVVGCGESTKDAMMRVAKERLARNQLDQDQQQEEEKKADEPAPAAPAPAPAAVATEPAPAAPAPAADAPKPQPPTEAPAEVRRKPRVIKQHPDKVLTEEIRGVNDVYQLKVQLDGQTPSQKELWRRQIVSLQKIGKAIREMQEDGEVLSDITDEGGQPLISWRVALLPYLGYNGLYRQFRLDEHWNSQHNSVLLAFVPDEFLDVVNLSIETPMVALNGPKLAFSEKTVLDFRAVSDKPESTLAIVDIGKIIPIPWTKPEDIYIEQAKDFRNVFMSRWSGTIVGLTVAGEPVRFSDQVGREALWAAVTASEGDGPEKDFFELLDENSPFEMAQSAAAAPTDNPDKENMENAPSNAPGLAANSLAAPPPDLGFALPPSNFFASIPEVRFPVPREGELKKAKDLLREVYGNRIKELKTADERKALCEEMLKDARQMVSDAPGGYALLQATRVVAGPTGDFNLWHQITETVIERYQVDPDKERRILVGEYAKLARLPGKTSIRPGQAALVTVQLLRLAVDRDDYAAAKDLVEYLQPLANYPESGLSRTSVNLLRGQIEKSSEEYSRSAAGIEALKRNESDDAAAYKVGSYLCYVKGDWKNGMPLLARGRGKVPDLVARELSAKPILSTYLEIADSWYEIGKEEKEDPLRREAALGRAAMWYRHLEPHVQGTLMKLQVGVRLKELGDTRTSMYQTLGELLQKLAESGQVQG